MSKETIGAGSADLNAEKRQINKTETVQDAVAKKDFNWIKNHMAEITEPMPFDTALEMIMEGGGGFPDTVINNLDKFSGVDGDVLVNRLIDMGHPYAVSNAWNILPEFNKSLTLDRLIKGHNIPTTKEGLSRLSGIGNVGDMINKLVDSGFGAEFLKVVMEHAEQGSLKKEVAEKLVTGGYDFTVKKNAELFDQGAQEYIAANAKN